VQCRWGKGMACCEWLCPLLCLTLEALTDDEVCAMQGEPWVSYGVGKCQMVACRSASRCHRIGVSRLLNVVHTCQLPLNQHPHLLVLAQ
jgi:hypothetical protein